MWCALYSAGESQPGWSLYMRAGDATENTSCTNVRAVPAELRSHVAMRPDGVSPYYTQYTEAYGIPVLGEYAHIRTTLIRHRAAI